MVAVTKTYEFSSADGSTKSLEELFGGKSQLIVYHFMFEPAADEGCRGCSFLADHFPDLRHLASKDTALVAVSRAPIDKLEKFKNTVGWTFPWYSSEASDFNYDFHVTLDEDVAPVEYNFRTKQQLIDRGIGYNTSGEQPGLSVFKLEDGKIFHTYSAYTRGLDHLLGTLSYLDLTPLGRQVGRSGPAEFKLRNEYGTEEAV